MDLNKTISNLLRYSLFILFVGYYTSITMCYHVHIVNGKVVSHSHPYKNDNSGKKPYESHAHSSSAYNSIQQIDKTIWDDNSVNALMPDPAICYSESFLKAKSLFITSGIHFYSSLRAPPLIG